MYAERLRVRLSSSPHAVLRPHSPIRMSLDWDGYVSHPRGPEGSMRALCPWAAMRLNNSRTAEMFINSHNFEKKSAEMAKLPGGARAYTPKDLELFAASEYQQKSCYKGYDKITTAPSHQTLPAWEIKPAILAKLQRGF